ncbi:MAG: hypothetical protein U0792_11150 [Gemmataceae bacterium]
MTEAEWLTCDNDEAMLAFLRNRGNLRKLRLFAVAACIRGWSLFIDERSGHAVKVAERFADGAASDRDLFTARADALAARRDVANAAPRSEFNWWGDAAAETAFSCAAADAFPPVGHAAPQHDYFTTAAGFMANALALVRVRQLEEETLLHELPDDGTYDEARQDMYEKADRICEEVRRSAWSAGAALLRDIFGNPFRPVSFDAEWRTSTAVLLAKQMYESRNFDAMPILADALEDAGCCNEHILNHCRDANGVHVRGCWVIDLVLGKK